MSQTLILIFQQNFIVFTDLKKGTIYLTLSASNRAYFDNAGTERQWVMCSCNRCIHRGCIDPGDNDNDIDKVCSLC